MPRFTLFIEKPIYIPEEEIESRSRCIETYLKGESLFYLQIMYALHFSHENVHYIQSCQQVYSFMCPSPPFYGD